MDDEMDTEMIETSVEIFRGIDGGVDVLREFRASVRCGSESGYAEIGTVSGWIGWQIEDEDIHDAADAISTDAEALGATAAEIVENHPDAFIDNALLIDRMYLEPQWRGKRLSGAIIADLLALLRFDPDSTIVVLQPEPQKPEGGPFRQCPERDEALTRLTAAYRTSGLEPWHNTKIWWRPIHIDPADDLET